MMRFRDSRVWLLAAVLAWSFLTTVSSQEKKDQDKAKSAHERYQEAVAMTRESLEQEVLLRAISLLEDASQLDPGREEIWVKLSDLYWCYGDSLPKETREQRSVRLEYFDKGISAGKKAREINPDSVGGLYWETTNMASGGEMKGILSSLWMFPTLLENMDRVDELDDFYDYGAVDRFWSEVTVRIPVWVTKRFGYTLEERATDLEDDIRREPGFFGNYTYLARIYWKIGKKDEALKALEYVLTHDPADLPERKADNINEKKAAGRMWKEYTGKEFREK
jgi:tetratricopeptide (TPR) repeat protein